MSRKIRAKMKCESVRREGDNEYVRFYPVFEGEENKQWSQWTPGGQLELCINNPTAQGAFEEGKEYFVDISPALEG